MKHKLSKNVSVTILKGKVYLHLEKYRPIVVNANDRFSSGIALQMCAGCKTFQTMRMYDGKKDYCDSCTLKICHKMLLPRIAENKANNYLALFEGFDGSFTLTAGQWMKIRKNLNKIVSESITEVISC